jgi:anti-anti-sigma factor
MSNVPLKTTFSLTGPVALIAFKGELEIGTAPRVGAQLHALLEAGAREILVDLTETTFLDCAGMGALIEVAGIAHERGGRLYVFRAQGQPRQLIERGRLGRVAVGT